MSRSGNEEDPLTGAQITGSLPSGIATAGAAGFLWSLSLNGHFAAFPAAYLGSMPDPAVNTARWTADPYAEDAARLVNYLLTQAQVVGVAAQDESNWVGFYPRNRRRRFLARRRVWHLHRCQHRRSDHLLHGPRALGLLVANLGGYVAQVGDSNRILGRPMEFVLQQMVDAAVWARTMAARTLARGTTLPTSAPMTFRPACGA